MFDALIIIIILSLWDLFDVMDKASSHDVLLLPIITLSNVGMELHKRVCVFVV